MSTSNRVCALVLGFALASLQTLAAGPYPGIGRAPTPDELKAWDIDVRPDFSGLPPGRGTVARGQEVWDAKCASCHGTFGESNEYFNPIIGGTTPDDVRTGVVKSLTTSALQRTTMMKLSSLAPLWDYIRRAMPWTAPKSLSDDDVYAVTAYILNLADLVPADFVLSDANIRQTEKLLPNRNGLTRAHGLWELRGRPDVHNAPCMTDCGPPVRIGSSMPDHARDAHGNLALQNRTIGGVVGADTTRAPLAFGEAREALRVAKAQAQAHVDTPLALANRHGCMACHGIERKVIGPAFRDVAARHAADKGASAALAIHIRTGGGGKWGDIPMPPQSQVTAADADLLAQWIAGGAAVP